MSTEATIGNLQSARRALDIALDVLKDGEGVSDANYNKLMSDITSLTERVASLTERVDDLPERDEDDQDVDSKVSDWMCNNFDLNDYDASSLDVDYQIESYISNNDVEIDIEGHRFTERVVEIVKDVLAESTFAVVEPAEEEEEESDDES
tara:strand:- start:62 stop:511 length:450 start_codon:yes stop_codon:yes gene_type:complete